MGAILLGAGLTFSVASTAVFAGRAGRTTVGQQGLVTFDPVSIGLQWRLPRALMGGTFGIAGPVLAGVGGWLFAKHGAVPGDEAVSATRLRRTRTVGAIAAGTGGALILTSLVLFGAAGGEWNSIPDDVGTPTPYHLQSAHNTAAFTSWGLGALALGVGLGSAGIGLLAGAKPERAAIAFAPARGGGQLTVARRF